MKSGFASLVGRPNVGKSTLLNKILDTKVSIVSNKPQTTRTQVRGVLNLRSATQRDRPDAQVVFIDTPGIHKPVTLLGERLNQTAVSSVGDVDVPVLVLDATAAIGRGDQFVVAQVVVPKDLTSAQREMLKQVGGLTGKPEKVAKGFFDKLRQAINLD